MVDKQHGAIVAGDGPSGLDGIHVTQNYTFATAGAHAAEVVDAEDVGKVAFRTDLPGFFVATAIGTGLQFWQRIDSQQRLVSNHTQVAHGFAAGQAVHSNNGSYNLSRANDADTLATGIVSEVTDANNFTVTTSGGFELTGHGFAANARLYVDSTTPGLLTTTRPTGPTQFQNIIGIAFDANTITVVPWQPEQSPQIAIRHEFTSQAAADVTSTLHAIQIGPSSGFHFKMSPGVFQVNSAIATAGNFRMQCGIYRIRNDPNATILETDSTDPLLLSKIETVAIDAAHTQRIGYKSNDGALTHGDIGFSGNFGLRFRNLKTGAANKQMQFVTQDGQYRFESSEPDIMRLETTSTVDIADPFTQNSLFTSSGGGVEHGSVGFRGTGGLTLRNLKTGSDNGDVTVEVANILNSLKSNRMVGTSNVSASRTSTTHALQAGDGTDQHIKIGGIVIGCYNGSNNPTAMDYDALRVRLNTDSSTPWQFRNPNDIDLAANYNCRFQFFSSTGAVLRGEIGWLGAEGCVFRNNQTNTGRGGFKFEMADPVRFISLQRTICIIADAATLSSNTHAFQVGADGAARTAFSANKLVAITAGGAQDTLEIDTSVLQTETVEMSSTTRAVVVPRCVNEAAVVNVQDGAIFYDTTAGSFKFRENGVWVTGSGLA